MNNNMMELTIDQMELANGGFSLNGALKGFCKGAVIGGVLGAMTGTP